MVGHIVALPKRLRKTKVFLGSNDCVVGRRQSVFGQQPLFFGRCQSVLGQQQLCLGVTKVFLGSSNCVLGAALKNNLWDKVRRTSLHHPKRSTLSDKDRCILQFVEREYYCGCRTKCLVSILVQLTPSCLAPPCIFPLCSVAPSRKECTLSDKAVS